MLTITTKSSTKAAIRDVLERYGSIGDLPATPPLRDRVRRRLGRVPRRRMVLAACAIATVPAGVAVDEASAEPAQGFKPAWASWYGPGLWGNALGCGGTLQPGTVGVAHKTKPCGSRVRLCVKRCTTAAVIDRGPFVAGREYDLTAALAARVGFRGVGRIFVRPTR
jgi:rare lipoprotein A (peptidoglycan hydrolase)